MGHKKIFLIVTSVVVITIILVFVVYKQKATQGIQGGKQTATTTTSVEPQKTDYGTKLPDDFPTDIPIEKGADIKQSYSLNYAGQKQLTIVFQSTKTVKENYVLYAEYLKKQGWGVVRNEANNNFLYGKKDNSEISVVITENEVIVGVLKK